MNESFEQSLTRIRAKRQHIARSVNEIVAICDADPVVLSKITWNGLIKTPSWCLMENKPLQALRIASGAVLGKNCIQSSLDGGVWKAFRSVVGRKLLEKLFAKDASVVELPSSPALELNTELSMFDNVNSWGAAVLLASLNNPALLGAYSKEWGIPSVQIDQETALHAYNIGLQLMNDIDSRSLNDDH